MTQKQIGKNLYSFRNAYYSLPIGKKKEVQKRLINLFGFKNIHSVYPKINRGIIDPRISIIEGVNKIFSEHDISDVWEITSVNK